MLFVNDSNKGYDQKTSIPYKLKNKLKIFRLSIYIFVILISCGAHSNAYAQKWYIPWLTGPGGVDTQSWPETAFDNSLDASLFACIEGNPLPSYPDHTNIISIPPSACLYNKGWEDPGWIFITYGFHWVELSECPNDGNEYVKNTVTGECEIRMKYFISYEPKQTCDDSQFCGNACSSDSPPMSGNPINTFGGNKYQNETDIDSLGLSGINFTRQYNSLQKQAGAFGSSWYHNYQNKLIPEYFHVFRQHQQENPLHSSIFTTRQKACELGWSQMHHNINGLPAGDITARYEDGQCKLFVNNRYWKSLAIYNNNSIAPAPIVVAWKVQRHDGRVYRFHQSNGKWVSSTNPELELQATSVGSVFKDENGKQETYDRNGRLLTITDRNGRQQQLTYNAENRLETVQGQDGASLTFSYQADGKLERITDHTNRIWQYHYDTAGMLVRVVRPDNTERQYLYEDSRFPQALTGIIDERNIRFATWSYDDEGRAKSSEHAGGVEKVNLSYVDLWTTVATNSRNVSTTYTFTNITGEPKLATVTGPGCTSCDSNDSQYEYDSAGNLIRAAEAGLVTRFGDYDANGNVGCRVDGISAADTNTEVCGFDPIASPDARRADTTYDPRFASKVKTITETSVHATGNKVTTYDYDAYGNTTLVRIDGFKPDGTAVARESTLQYFGPLNQLSQIDGPRTDVNDITTLVYYLDDPSEGHNRARLKTVTTPIGIVRDNIQYSASGKVLSETRANGLTLTYTYYAGNNRLESVTETAGTTSRTTRWTYLETGEVETITLGYGSLDAATMTFGYDDARRLTSITDALGNVIQYTLDTESNRIKQEIIDQSGVLYRTLEQTFDIYDRLDQIIQIDDILDINFAADGTLANQTDAKSVTTEYGYDALKRLVTTTGDVGGFDLATQDILTKYTYDVADRLIKITAPNNAETSYRYDDLGNLLFETSPDRGARQYTYDEAGNVKTMTDARNITATYSYDALNRLTAIDYPGTSEDVSYTYDTCANGLGRVCQIVDQNGTTNYAYNAFGQITSQSKTELGVTYATYYDYDLLDRVTQVTTPTGRIIDYHYNANSQITAVDADVNGAVQTIVHNMNYRADGLLAEREFGNGFVEQRYYNLKGQLTNLTTPALGGVTEVLAIYDTAASTMAGITIPVLANDIYTDISAVALTITVPPEKGVAQVNADKTITYTPKYAFSGADPFTYQIQEGTATSLATVVVELSGDVTTVDTDNDEIPDIWETTYGLDPLLASDAVLDADGDGITNLDEYQQGTDPTVWNIGLAWIDDAGPGGAQATGTWVFASSNPVPYSGAASLQSGVVSGMEQHVFHQATEVMSVAAGDTLVAYVYLDPVNPPREIMLQWYANNSWEHRAYWGENLVDWGTNGSVSRRNLGALPPTGQWVRLEVPASAVGLEGETVSGMAFTLYDGRAAWDYAGKTTLSDSDGDGMPDSWEQRFGLNSLDAADALLDPDNDGITNLDEYRYVSDPRMAKMWIDDMAPGGAQANGTWLFASYNPSPFSGGVSLQSSVTSGFHQHYFQNATEVMSVAAGDTLIAYVYLDPANPPRELMLQWQASDGWDHRAYWGENLITWGTNGTVSRRYMGALPPTGQWVRLEVPASAVGLEGLTVSGMAFTLYDGRAAWDYAGRTVLPDGDADGMPDTWEQRYGLNPQDASDAAQDLDGDGLSNLAEYRIWSDPTTWNIASPWIDDAWPADAQTNGNWVFAGDSPSPFSGGVSLQSSVASGFHQHYFQNATEVMSVAAGDTLIAYVYLDPANPPRELMLQWYANNSWEHRAYWGENLVAWGVDGTVSRRYMGALPPTGEWVRLEVPASAVGLEGATVSGMAFTLYDGRAAWDYVGRTVLPDGDADGMPDSWEQRYGLNPLDASDAAQDLDGDGLSNLDEYRQGSDPSIVTALNAQERRGDIRLASINRAVNIHPVSFKKERNTHGAFYRTGGVTSDQVSQATDTPASTRVESKDRSRQLLVLRTVGKDKTSQVYRKGPETQHKWVQTAEDPNAYDRPAKVYVFNSLTGFDTGFETGRFIKVNHGTVSNPVSIGSEIWSYVYDANGNVTSINSSAGDQLYGYDNLNRLIDDDTPIASQLTYDYDRNGNRIAQDASGAITTYDYTANSNRISAIAAQTIQLDETGNTINDGRFTYTYNQAGRLFEVYEAGSLVATYTYNALGQRTRKVTPTETIIYHYDLNGQLLSETTDSGTAIRDYVWMNETPVAQIDTDGVNDNVVYLHTDHLNTPRRATDAAGVVVWRWQSDAFGATAANEDPDNDGTAFTLNLRFPGQYYDSESGLHYNYFRYYDPRTGRYITSDPIGLAGGLNTYGYVLQNPVIYIDPLGLCGRGFSEVEGNPGVCKANGMVNPDRCASGVCGAYGGTNPLNANSPPRVPRRKSDCAQCREQCIQEFINPIPGLLIEEGAGAAGKKINDLAGDFAKDFAKKGNKVKGAYDLGECLDSCKKICNDNSCDQ